jgi:hypothetical protein
MHLLTSRSGQLLHRIISELDDERRRPKFYSMHVFTDRVLTRNRRWLWQLGVDAQLQPYTVSA